MLNLDDFINRKYTKINKKSIERRKSKTIIHWKNLHLMKSQIENKIDSAIIGFFGLSVDFSRDAFIYHRYSHLSDICGGEFPRSLKLESKTEYLQELIEFIQIWNATQRGFIYWDQRVNIEWFRDKRFKQIRRDLLLNHKSATRYYLKEFKSIDQSIISFIKYGKLHGFFPQSQLKLYQCPRCGHLGFTKPENIHCKYCQNIQ